MGASDVLDLNFQNITSNHKSQIERAVQNDIFQYFYVNNRHFFRGDFVTQKKLQLTTL